MDAQAEFAVFVDFDLTARNTLGLASHARYGCVLRDAADIPAALAFAQARGLPFHVLGGGGNCVLGERVEAVVAVMAQKGRWIERDASGVVRVTAKAGESWPDLVAWTAVQGVGGLENLAGIPGSVGAAPVQNIGAYGRAIGDVLESLTAFDVIEGRFKRFEARECGVGYRQSRFKATPGRYVITEVTLALPQPWTPTLTYDGLARLPRGCAPWEIMEVVLAVRRSKLPDWREIGNVGSFFHNPVVAPDVAARLPDAPARAVEDGVKLSAGWLLEACGLRGWRSGPVGFSAEHALVLVNHGGATFEDVRRAAAHAVREVKARFGITLVQEPATLA